MSTLFSCTLRWREAFPLNKLDSRSRGRKMTKGARLSTVRAEADVLNEEIVVVGAGIAGLATSLSLNRFDDYFHVRANFKFIVSTCLLN